MVVNYPKWKFSELIGLMDGVQGAYTLLHKHGFNPPPLNTIAGWHRRNSAPGPWAFALLLAAHKEMNGFPKLENLLIGQDEAEPCE